MLNEQVIRACENLKELKTLMVYSCQFSDEAARLGLLNFASRFLQTGISLSRLWMEEFFNESTEAATLFQLLQANP